MGVTCPRGVRADTPAELASASAALHAPLALKGLGHPHKSEAGLVQLNLTADALASAANMMDGAKGFLVVEMGRCQSASCWLVCVVIRLMKSA